MVKIQQHHAYNRQQILGKHLNRVAIIGLVILGSLFLALLSRKSPPSSLESATIRGEINANSCPYRSIADFTEDELHPKEGKRHMVTPPAGGTISLVCCQTTKGPLSIAVHSKWAPNGAQRFLEMVQSGYFNDGVPLMRCIKGFLCQFGLAGAKSKLYRASVPDDPNWLPEGAKYRENDKGVKRFALGYMAYAGAGPRTRDNQLIVSLKANGPLAGGSPWEVPWGELVGTHSFETLSQIYTGYDEKGPPQGLLWKEGAIEQVKVKWPLLDFITSCQLVDQLEQA
jgi:cyclophilin family peptidyl-prolyl cis-trans isomerase